MAVLTLSLIAGVWTTTCIATQIEERNGYARETYRIEKTGAYEFKREWFRDSDCTRKINETTEKGRLSIKKRLQNESFAGDAHAVDFQSKDGVAHGAIGKRGQALRFARGTPGDGNRNTMLGVFDYLKRPDDEK